ncbi:unnamed protein product, partial [Allacma fusca]
KGADCNIHLDEHSRQEGPLYDFSDSDFELEVEDDLSDEENEQYLGDTDTVTYAVKQYMYAGPYVHHYSHSKGVKFPKVDEEVTLGYKPDYSIAGEKQSISSVEIPGFIFRFSTKWFTADGLLEIPPDAVLDGYQLTIWLHYTNKTTTKNPLEDPKNQTVDVVLFAGGSGANKGEKIKASAKNTNGTAKTRSNKNVAKNLNRQLSKEEVTKTPQAKTNKLVTSEKKTEHPHAKDRYGKRTKHGKKGALKKFAKDLYEEDKISSKKRKSRSPLESGSESKTDLSVEETKGILNFRSANWQ